MSIFSLDNPEQLTAIQKVVNRAYEAMMQTQNREKRRSDKELRSLNQIRKQVGSAAPGSPITLNRLEIRLLQGLLVATSSTLYTSVIPNYKKRIEMEPDNKNRYEPYIEQCESRILVYKKVLDNLNNCL